MSKIKESLAGRVSSWLTLIASFFLSFATWVAIGEIAGFNDKWDAGEVWDVLPVISLAWALPICVDGYVVTALITWLAPVSEEIAVVAKWNTYVGAIVGILAQSGYHGWAAADRKLNWFLVGLSVVVGALPPALSAGAVHMRAMVRRAAIRSTESGAQGGIVLQASGAQPSGAQNSTLGNSAPSTWSTMIGSTPGSAPSYPERDDRSNGNSAPDMGAPDTWSTMGYRAPDDSEHEWERSVGDQAGRLPDSPVSPAGPVLDWNALESWRRELLVGEHRAFPLGQVDRAPDTGSTTGPHAPNNLEHNEGGDKGRAPNYLEHDGSEHNTGAPGNSAPDPRSTIGDRAPSTGAPKDQVAEIMRQVPDVTAEVVADRVGIHKKTAARMMREIREEQGGG